MKYTLATVAIVVVSYMLLMTHTTTLSVAQVGSGKKSGSSSKSSARQPIELGKVAWGRNLEEAVAKSKQNNKPIALLFQEVPGWSGCKQYGQQVLAQPRVVEILESDFIPVAIYNNSGGYDRKILNQFNEPSWNYQVMRFLDSDLNDLIPRKDKVWDVRAFAMFCFWTGEAKLGSLDGVYETEAGFYDGHEVVLVKYNEQEIDLLTLVNEAEKFDCASAVYLPDAADRKLVKDKTRLRTVKNFDFSSGYRRAPESDQKRQLSSAKSMLKKLDLTPTQWTKLNSRGVSGASVRKLLSDSQYEALRTSR